jgi:hypothetical protein
MPAASWCRAARKSATVVSVVSALWLLAPSAHAQEATPPPPAPAAAAAPPAGPLFAGTHFGIGSSFGADSPVAFLAGNTESVLWGAGIIFAYDGNAMTDKTHANLVLSLAYMVHNQFPFAMGPEIDYIPQIAPSAFDSNSVRAGWALWYAPWNIPAVIGTAAFVNFDFVSGKSAVVTSITPAVRIVFGFH